MSFSASALSPEIEIITGWVEVFAGDIDLLGILSPLKCFESEVGKGPLTAKYRDQFLSGLGIFLELFIGFPPAIVADLSV